MLPITIIYYGWCGNCDFSTNSTYEKSGGCYAFYE